MLFHLWQRPLSWHFIKWRHQLIVLETLQKQQSVGVPVLLPHIQANLLLQLLDPLVHPDPFVLIETDSMFVDH